MKPITKHQQPRDHSDPRPRPLFSNILARDSGRIEKTHNRGLTDSDILTDLITAADASGLRPNRILFDDVAWNKRLLSHRAQATAGGFASASLKPDEAIYAEEPSALSNRRALLTLRIRVAVASGF